MVKIYSIWGFAGKILTLSSQIPKSETPQPTETVTKLGIGVQGGFQSGAQADAIEKSYKLFVGAADEVLELQNETIPEAIRACAESIKVSGYVLMLNP